jgi:hypothetical protein
MILIQMFNSRLTSANALTADFNSSRECAAEICVRIRALPFGMNGYENPMK